MEVIVPIVFIFIALVLWVVAELLRLQHRSWGLFKEDWMLAVFYFILLGSASFLVVCGILTIVKGW